MSEIEKLERENLGALEDKLVLWKHIGELHARIAELEAAQEANDKLVLGYCSRITKLEAALKECADDLEAEITARYDGTRHFTSQQRKWERDMAIVDAARAALEGKE